jgi:hypothetical protein
VIARLVLALATALWLPATAWGQNQADLSPDLVHERFAKCGYDVTPPVLLGQQSLGTSVRIAPLGPGDELHFLAVRDPQDRERDDGRSLAILRFRDSQRAGQVFQESVDAVVLADRMEASAQPGGPGAVGPAPSTQFTTDRGPPLLLGHGLSVWRQNVAMVQLGTPPSTLMTEIRAELGRRGVDPAQATSQEYEAATEAALSRMRPRARESLRRAPYGVDRDFVACLEGQQAARIELATDPLALSR